MISWFPIFLVVIALAKGPLCEEKSSFSLMLSKAEESSIKNAKKESPHSVVNEFVAVDASKDLYHLSAIIFIDKKRWTILLNDQAFQSDDQQNVPFKIKTVDAKGITALIRKRFVKIKVNQTVDVTTGAVYDGDASPSDIQVTAK